MTHFVNQHIMGVAQTVSNHPKWSRLVELVKDLAKNKATLEKYFQVLVKFKPSKGDADSWKTKTEALVAALKSGKQEDLNKASNCKACHSVHKP